MESPTRPRAASGSRAVGYALSMSPRAHLHLPALALGLLLPR